MATPYPWKSSQNSCGVQSITIIYHKQKNDKMKQTVLPEAIYLDVDSLNYEEYAFNAALVAAIVEPVNRIGVI